MIWYFREGTEERVEVARVTHQQAGGQRVALAPAEQRYILTCGACGTRFALYPVDHGVTVGADGALSAEHSFNCPKCGHWHRHVRGGVLSG